MTTDAVVRQSGEDIIGTVRTVLGIFDTERRDGRWTCSCGRAEWCVHVAHVEAAMTDAEVALAKSVSPAAGPIGTTP